MKRLVITGILLLFAGFLVTPSVASASCAALGGTVVGSECQVAGTVNVSGSITVGTPGSPVTLRIQPTGRLVVPEAVVQNAVSLLVYGDLVMEQGARITGDATGTLGAASNVTVTVTGSIVLRGDATTGASITANTTSLVCTAGGPGKVTVVSTRGSITTEDGTAISANSACRGGEVVLTADYGNISLAGDVESVSGGTGPAPTPPGGPITLITGGTLTVLPTSQVRSAGRDNGADLVHLESGGDMVIRGPVLSTGGVLWPGPGSNRCATADRPNSTGCVELWATGNLTIDSINGLGQVSAKTGVQAGSVGVCCSWVDVFANKDVTIKGPLNTATSRPFAVNADQLTLNGFAGHLTAKAVKGKLTASGRAFSAQAVTEVGGVGGRIVIEAGGPTFYPANVDHAPDPASNVDLGNSQTFAIGDTNGGAATGGFVSIRSYNGDVTGGNGTGNVSGGTIQANTNGTINLLWQYCGDPLYIGVLVPNLAARPEACGGRPPIPAIVAAAFLPRPVVVLPNASMAAGGFNQATYEATARTYHPDDVLQQSPLGLPLAFAYVDAGGVPVVQPTNGVYFVTASFAGNAEYKPASTVATLILFTGNTPVALTISDTTTTYNAQPQGVTVTADPAVSPVNCTYNGSPARPITAGQYAVVCSFAGDTDHMSATETATFTIDKADPAVNAVGGVFTYDGNAHGSGAVTGVPGETTALVATVSFLDTVATTTSAIAPRNAGIYVVSASFAGNTNYNPAGPATADLIIDRAPATIVIHDATASTSCPNGMTVTLVGVGTICRPFTGLAQGAVVTATGVPPGNPESLTAFVTVSYSVNGDVVPTPSAPGAYLVTASVDHPNYLPGTVTATLAIYQRKPSSLTLSGLGTFQFDGQPHTAAASVIDVETSQPVAGAVVSITYTDLNNQGVAAPLAMGSYAVLATFGGNATHDPSQATGTIRISAGTLAGEGCIVVDFREVTYFRDRTVIMSSNAVIRDQGGIAGAFDPFTWPYAPKGGKDQTSSRGTQFRIYGFAEIQLGSSVRDADTGVEYEIVADPGIPGSRYVELGGPARVIVCPSQLQTALLERNAKVQRWNVPGTTVLTDSQRNVPGIMLSHNQDRIKVPARVRDELRALGTPLTVLGRDVTYGVVDYIGFQQWGAGETALREFVDVEVQFIADDPADRPTHYTYGFHTVSMGSFNPGPGCNYRDYTPGDDRTRFHDVWAGTDRKNAGAACGSLEPASNQLLRADYDLELSAVQLLSTVGSNDDTARIFYGEIRPDGKREPGDTDD